MLYNQFTYVVTRTPLPTPDFTASEHFRPLPTPLHLSVTPSPQLLNLDLTTKKDFMVSLSKKNDIRKVDESEEQTFDLNKKFNELSFFIVNVSKFALLEVGLLVGHLMTTSSSNVSNTILWITNTRIRKSVAMEAYLWAIL